MQTRTNFYMLSRGFASLALVLMVVLGLAAFGGGGWYYLHKTPVQSNVGVNVSITPVAGATPLFVSIKIEGIPNDTYSKYAIDYGDQTRYQANYIRPCFGRYAQDIQRMYYCNGTLMVGHNYGKAGTYSLVVSAGDAPVKTAVITAN